MAPKERDTQEIADDLLGLLDDGDLISEATIPENTSPQSESTPKAQADTSKKAPTPKKKQNAPAR